MNEVLKLDAFNQKYWSLDGSERYWVDRVFEQLKKSLSVGKPLRFEWLREKKFGANRLYFIVDNQHHRAILVAYGNKKEQQNTINYVINNKEYYLSLFR